MLKSQSQYTSLAGTLASDGIPSDLLTWLTRLKLLVGVPFNYLVPDNDFLPPESIRFFHVDPNWVNALADGALSIGRHYNGPDNPSPTLHAERASGAKANDHPTMNLANFRRAQLRQPTKALDTEALTTSRTGFLLHSDVVKSWKTIDVAGYAQGSSPYDYQTNPDVTAEDVKTLPILRLVRLSDKVMLGIFDGELFELVLHQPPEAIHFGFDQIFSGHSADNVTKTLRVPTINWDDPDTQYNSDTYQDIELAEVFADKDARVLDMMSLSKTLGAALHATGPDGAPGYYQAKPESANFKDHLVASDFGLEMVHGVGLVSFINK